MKRIYLFAFSAVFALSLIFLNSDSSFAQRGVITLKYSNFFPPYNRISVLCDAWCKEVEKRTNGRVKVYYFPGSTLTRADQTFDAVKLGIADVGMSFMSYTIGRFPLSEVLDLPIGVKSGYWATKMSNAYYENFKPKEFDDVEVMYLTTVPPHNLFTKRPIDNLEGLRGLKMRSTGTTAQLIQALGAAPVAMPMSEAYDAIAKGVVDGLHAPLEPMKGFRLAEVVSYCILFESAWAGSAFVVMNKGKWNSLPEDIQAIINDINRDWIEKQAKLWDELDQEGKEYFLEKGGKIIELSKEENARWTERLRPILDEYVKKMNDRGLPGEEALKFCIDYLKAHR